MSQKVKQRLNENQQIVLLSRGVPCVLFAVMAWYALTFYMPTPVAEHFRILDLRDKWVAGQYHFMDANQLWGGNWNLFGLNAEVFLSLFTGWDLGAEAALNVLVVGAIFLVWAWMVRRAFNGESERAVLLALGAVFIFSLNQAMNLVWTWQTALFLHSLGIVMCIATLAIPNYRLKHLAVAMLGTLLAVYDMTSGLVVLFVYAAAMWCHPTARRWLWCWVPFALAVGGHTVFALQAQLDRGLTWNNMEFSLSPAFIGNLLFFTWVYIALPVLAAAPWMSAVLGVAAMVWCAWINWRLLMHCDRDRILCLLPAVALMDIVLGGAMMVAVGRQGIGVEEMIPSGRYFSFANLFWLGACMVVVADKELLPKVLRNTPRRWRTFLTIVVVLMVYSTLCALAFNEWRVNYSHWVKSELRQNWEHVDWEKVDEVPLYVEQASSGELQKHYFTRLREQKLGIFKEE